MDSSRDRSGIDERDAAYAHKVFRVLVTATVLAVLVSVALNWWFVKGTGSPLPSGQVVSPGVPAPEAITLDKPATEYLPDRILQFETITHQPIPGREDRAAEAIYRTLNMNLEAQIGIVVYARVEGYGS